MRTLRRFDSRQVALAGVGLILAGAWLLDEAFESRGKRRPFGLRLLPG